MVADTTVVRRRTGRSTPPTCDSSRTAGQSAARSRDDVHFSLPSLVRALFIILVGAADEPRRREATDDLRTACQLALPASRQRISRCSMRLPFRYQTQSRPVSASPEFAAFRPSYLIACPPRNGLEIEGPGTPPPSRRNPGSDWARATRFPHARAFANVPWTVRIMERRDGEARRRPARAHATRPRRCSDASR